MRCVTPHRRPCPHTHPPHADARPPLQRPQLEIEALHAADQLDRDIDAYNARARARTHSGVTEHYGGAQGDNNAVGLLVLACACALLLLLVQRGRRAARMRRDNLGVNAGGVGGGGRASQHQRWKLLRATAKGVPQLLVVGAHSTARAISRACQAAQLRLRRGIGSSISTDSQRPKHKRSASAGSGVVLQSIASVASASNLESLHAAASKLLGVGTAGTSTGGSGGVAGAPGVETGTAPESFEAAPGGVASHDRPQQPPGMSTPSLDVVDGKHDSESADAATTVRRTASYPPSTSSGPLPEVDGCGFFPGVRTPHHRPIIRRQSVADWIVRSCPAHCSAADWRLLYSTARDGVSLHTLFRKCRGCTSACLLLVRDTLGATLGCYTSDPWHQSARGRGYGTGECFVLSLGYAHASVAADDRAAVSGAAVYRWTKANSHFQAGSSDFIAIGGGSHFALWLDSELHFGSSGACETFGSPCLASSEEFKIDRVEVWAASDI